MAGFKVGSTDVSTIKVGSTQVERIYVGSDTVWTNYIPEGFLSTTTWYAPSSGTYTFHAIGGGGGGSDYFGNNGSIYGAGGGSGYYTTTSVSLSAGQAVTISIGAGGAPFATGGTTSIVSGGTTLLSAAGGQGAPSSGAGGDGGSGGAPGVSGSQFIRAHGGYHGSDGETNDLQEGLGQLGVAFGLGTNPYIPPGGSSSYEAALAAAYYDGIYGFGAGAQAASNQDGICAGGGAGGATWAQPRRSGQSGMVVIE